MVDSQVGKAVASGSYFITGCLAIVASQILGAPLYLLNQEWYNAWIALTKQSFGLLTTTVTQCFAPTIIRVSGDKSVRGQLLPLVNGGLLCDFPERMILLANHQIYTDWLYLWWIAYTNGMHGRIYIVLKESLRRIPIIGWGMQFSQFIFLKRKWENDKPNLAAHLQKLNKPSDPMWLLLFPEGTNLAPCTRQKSAEWAAKHGIKDLQHQLLPRSTGLQFCLQQLHSSVEYVYDCTIAYEGVPHGKYAQDIFTIQAAYFQSRPPKSVNMYWRRFPVSSIPFNDSKAFELWLRTRWTEKDMLIEMYLRNGRFPADRGVDKTPNGTTRRGAGYIETEIKAFHWYEFLQIFAPIGLFGLVLYAFYGALPGTFLNYFQTPAVLEKLKLFQKQIMGSQAKLLAGPEGKAAKAWGSELMRLQNTATSMARGTPAKKALLNGTTPQQVKALATTTKGAHVQAAGQQQQNGTKPKTQRLLIEAKPAPKKLEVRPATKPVPKKLEPKKKLATKTINTAAQKKLVPRTPVVAKQMETQPPKLPAKKAGMAPSTVSTASSKPKKLEIKPKPQTKSSKQPILRPALKKIVQT